MKQWQRKIDWIGVLVIVCLQSFLDKLRHFTLDSLIRYKRLPFEQSLLFLSSYRYYQCAIEGTIDKVLYLPARIIVCKASNLNSLRG